MYIAILLSVSLKVINWLEEMKRRKGEASCFIKVISVKKRRALVYAEWQRHLSLKLK